MNLQRNLAAAGFLLAALAAPVAHAAGTVAGTVVYNTATLTFDAPDPLNPGGPAVPQTPETSTHNFAVAEVLDVVVTATTPITTVVANTTDRELRYSVTNTGNGQEQYNLVVDYADVSDDFDPTNVRIYTQIGGGPEVLYTPGVTNLVLNPDQQVTVIVRGDIPVNNSSANPLASGDEANVTLRALSNTVQAAHGTAFQSQAPGTTVATSTVTDLGVTYTYAVVVGNTHADERVSAKYVVQQVSGRLTKTATAVHPTLGAGVYAPGTRITYRLQLDVEGDGELTKVRIRDTVPTHTTYAGNLTLAYGAGATPAAALAALGAAVTLNPSANGDQGVLVGNEVNVAPGGNDGNYTDSGTVLVGGVEPAAKVYVVTFDVTVD